MSSTKLTELELREIMAYAGLSPRTSYIYVRKLQMLQDWLAHRGHTLADAPAVAISEFGHNQPPSRSTRVQYRSCLKYLDEHLGITPPRYRAISVPPKPRMVCKALDDQPASKVYRQAMAWDEGPEGLAVLLGMQMALRRFEISHLKWADFRADWVTVHGKGGVIADVPVSPDVRAKLKWWRKWELDDPTDPSCRPGKTYLFRGRGGESTHVTPTTVWNWSRRVSERAGVGRVPTHVLRHTALAVANDNTGNLRAVQALARHRDPETTAGYTRVPRDQLMATMLSIKYDCEPE